MNRTNTAPYGDGVTSVGPPLIDIEAEELDGMERANPSTDYCMLAMFPESKGTTKSNEQDDAQDEYVHDDSDEDDEAFLDEVYVQQQGDDADDPETLSGQSTPGVATGESDTMMAPAMSFHSTIATANHDANPAVQRMSRSERKRMKARIRGARKAFFNDENSEALLLDPELAFPIGLPVDVMQFEILPHLGYHDLVHFAAVCPGVNMIIDNDKQFWKTFFYAAHLNTHPNFLHGKRKKVSVIYTKNPDFQHIVRYVVEGILPDNKTPSWREAIQKRQQLLRSKDMEFIRKELRRRIAKWDENKEAKYPRVVQCQHEQVRLVKRLYRYKCLDCGAIMHASTIHLKRVMETYW